MSYKQYLLCFKTDGGVPSILTPKISINVMRHLNPLTWINLDTHCFSRDKNTSLILKPTEYVNISMYDAALTLIRCFIAVRLFGTVVTIQLFL